MFSRLSLPAVAFALLAACNRSPAPAPEKAMPDQLVPRYQAATPDNQPTNGSPASTTETDRDGVNSGPGTPNGTGMNTVTGSQGAPARDDMIRASPSDPGAEVLDDAQIARITHDVNTAEIEQGKLARRKASDARVKAFAERMIKHHSEAKDKQAKLELDTAGSELATKLERNGSETLAELRENSGARFDQEYMSAQVTEHERVLATIDRQLLPNAKNGALKTYLEQIRPTVEAHLKDARALETKLTEQAAAPDHNRK